MKLIAVDPEVDSDFNHTAADAVYKAMTAMDPDTALVYGRILLADSVRYDLIAHREELNKAAGELVEQRARRLQQYYTRTSVSKARAGRDNTHEITCLVHIAKAFNFSEQERQQYARKRTRGPGGRFVQEHIRIETDRKMAPLDQKDAVIRQGIPEARNLDDRDLAHYQQAYGQIRDMLAPFHHQDLNAVLHLNIAARNGTERTEQVAVGGKGKLTDVQAALRPGDRIQTAQVSMRPAPTAGGAAFDVLAAAGAPRAGGYVADAYSGVLSPGRLGQFNTERQTVGDNEPFSAASRAFGRLERGGDLLRDSLGDDAPAPVRYAAAVANHVGQFGPEAQKVIGPAADRAAYRYRGTERAPDPELVRSFDRMRTEEGFRGKRGEALREATVGGIITRVGWDPGPVLGYFRGQLPNPDLNELHRRSGTIPPSEGIIIGPHGRVAHQSVGYADDWYLPFNLRHLGALKGGEYIRTRTFGGPTTEDIYTGLISGARSMTVVSHNGVYTVDFDRNLRGGRRFNDKAARMVARYGQLLDAVRSEQVNRGGISPSRMQEMRDDVRENFESDESSQAFRDRLAQLQVQERSTPVLSRQESDAVAAEWLGAAAARYSTGDARVMAPEELLGSAIDKEAATRAQADKATLAQMGVEQVYTLPEFRAEVVREIEGLSPTERNRTAAGWLGETASFDRAMQRAGEANRDRVKSLKLNGTGYEAALKALQEQFPYYLKTTYTPWRGSMGVGGDQTLERARDTGYVAPRFNRPQAAEAGYFNRDVTGRGKVDAQSVRYQNFRVGGGKLTEHRLTPVSRAAAPDGDFAGRSAAPAGAPAAARPVVSDADRLRAANKALLDDILAKETFDEGATVAGKNQSGRSIREDVELDGWPHPELKRVFLTPPAELEAGPPEELRDLLMKVVALSQGRQKVFALNDAKVRAVRNNGRVEPPKPAPALLGPMLAELDIDHVFPGQAYDAARIVAPDMIERTFNADLKHLVDAGDLLPVSDPAFGTKVASLKQRLTDADTEHTRLRGVGGGVAPSMRQDLRDAEGLLRATQLRRRWEDAVKNTPAPAAADAGAAVSNQLTIVLPADGADSDLAQRLTQAFGGGSTPAVGT